MTAFITFSVRSQCTQVESQIASHAKNKKKDERKSWGKKRKGEEDEEKEKERQTGSTKLCTIEIKRKARKEKGRQEEKKSERTKQQLVKHHHQFNDVGIQI